MLIMNGRRLTAGTLSDTTDSSTQYLWQCTGSNGGTAASCSLPVPQTSTKFTQGDRVRVTETMNVRAGASANSALRGAQPAGALGTITGGPTANGGYFWWNIDYDTGADGWSVEDYLVKRETPASYTLTVTKGGEGTGTVTSSPSGLSCTGSICTITAEFGTAITLFASPSSNSIFYGWSGGGCAGTGTCSLTLSLNTAITASFNQSAEIGGTVTISLEAESGSLVPTMQTYQDAEASGGSYIYTATDNSGRATYTVNLPRAGVYYLWGRILSPTPTNDSFYVSVDGEAEDIYDTAENLWSPLWQWTRITGRIANGGTISLRNENPRQFQFSSGEHTVTLRGRDPDTRLDKIILTTDGSFVPQDGIETPDSDSDGIPNSSDRCPNTPAPLRASVNASGCPLPKMTKFSHKTDLASADLTALTSLELGNASGRISFSSAGAPINLVREGASAELDIDSALTIGSNSVTLNAAALPELNKAATITLYGLTVKKPKVMRDGVLCTACEIVSYQNGTLVFTVPGFSTYTIEDEEETSDTTPPAIAITNPSDGVSLTEGTISITATSSDSSLYGVRFAIDGTYVNDFATTSPFAFSWQAGAGSHAISAIARDTAFNYATATVSVTVIETAPPPPASGGGGGGGGGGGYLPPVVVPTTPMATTTVATAAPTTPVTLQAPVCANSSFRKLTCSQIDSIVKLLIAFNANQSVIDNVRLTLLGAPSPSPVSNLPASIAAALFTRPLSLGMKGADVKTLQEFLNARGFTIAATGPGSSGKETTFFGPATYRAVIKFQDAYAADILIPVNLKKGTGYFGPATIRKANILR